MKLRNFILAVSLSVAALWPSSACVDYEDPSLYNLFACTPEMPSIDEKRLDESVQFWAKYLGITPDDGFRHAVSYMWESQFEEENIESNIFLNTLSKQGKTDALQLVRLNWELSDLIERATNSWSYQKTTPADYNALLAKIDALRLTGDLSRRKTFLKMRCLFALKDYDACLRLWDMFASKWEDSPLKQRAYGYVAGIYFRKGQFEKAMDIYFEQGDRGSIRKCVNRILEKSNIAEIYDKDPNAPILNHFLEDYANYFYHSAYDHTWHMYDQKEYPIWSAVNNQRKDVLALAQRVVKEGKAKDLQMWQTFIGFVQFTSGEYDQAYSSFTQAEGMPGTLLKDRLRIYKFISLLAAENKPTGFDEYLAKELEHVFAIRHDGDKQDVKALVSMLLDYEIPTRLNTYLDERNDKALSILANLAIENYSKIYYYEEEMTSDIARNILSYVENIGQDDALTLAAVILLGDVHAGQTLTAEEIDILITAVTGFHSEKVSRDFVLADATGAGKLKLCRSHQTIGGAENVQHFVHSVVLSSAHLNELFLIDAAGFSLGFLVGRNDRHKCCSFQKHLFCFREVFLPSSCLYCTTSC